MFVFRIQNLSLRHCKITDKGCAGIGRALGTAKVANTKLLSLNMTGNEIEDQGAEHLAGVKYSHLLYSFYVLKNILHIFFLHVVYSKIRIKSSQFSWIRFVGNNSEQNLDGYDGLYSFYVLKTFTHIFFLYVVCDEIRIKSRKNAIM